MRNTNNFNRRNYGQGGWLSKVPGFRSDVMWKKIVAAIVYFFIALLALVLLLEGGIMGFISFLAMIAFFGSLVALIKGNLSLFKIPNRKIAGVVLVASSILIGVLPTPSEEVQDDAGLQSSETETAKVEKEEAQKQQRAEQKSKAEEEAKAEKEAAEEKAEEERLALEAEEARKAQEAKDAEEQRKAQEAEEARIAKEKAKDEATKAAAAKKKQKTANNATVTRVVDGDTLEVSMNGQTEMIRLLLIDTPETVHPQKPVEPFGQEASQFVKDTLEGKEVRVKVGTEERDNYDRMLAYVYLGEETIQEKLLANGLAATAYLYNDLTMLDAFHQAQQAAIDSGKGVWSIPGYAHVDHDHGFHYEEEAQPEPEPAPEAAPAAPAPDSNLQYDPAGPDRDCGDFSSQAAAQAFMEASGPSDPHRLDGNDDDGLACESLP